MAQDPSDITGLLLQLRAGDKDAEAYLIAVVYPELRRIAARRLRGEAANHSLEPTALVNEAYLRMAKMGDKFYENRSHFFATAATLMRNIVVDHAREQKAAKRGGGQQMVSYVDGLMAAPQKSTDVLALDDALNRLAEMDARQARIVELRFFAGLTEEETAEVLCVSARTVKRDWRIAKAWLYAEIAA